MNAPTTARAHVTRILMKGTRGIADQQVALARRVAARRLLQVHGFGCLN